MLRRALTSMPVLARGMSRGMATEARPMTRFIQYPFDKTKMAEVTEWFDSSGIAATIRSKPGVKDLEVSFCPGEGWVRHAASIPGYLPYPHLCASCLAPVSCR